MLDWDKSYGGGGPIGPPIPGIPPNPYIFINQWKINYYIKLANVKLCSI
jgi:hypothetical protein